MFILFDWNLFPFNSVYILFKFFWVQRYCYFSWVILNKSWAYIIYFSFIYIYTPLYYRKAYIFQRCYICIFKNILTLNTSKLFWKKKQYPLSIALYSLYSYNLNSIKSIRSLSVIICTLIPFLYYSAFAFQSINIAILKE